MSSYHYQEQYSEERYCITILIMLVVSRFVVRLVDATVQINDDIGLLILLLVIVNAIIVVILVSLGQRSYNFRTTVPQLCGQRS